MKVTAETITDDQIRQLRFLMVHERGGAPMVMSACWALGESRWYAGIDCRIASGDEERLRQLGRAQCAESWNACHGAVLP